jgi:hypothetical protein
VPTPGRRRGGVAGLLLAGPPLLLGPPGPAPWREERAVVWFVPELLGAVSLDLAAGQRFEGVVDTYDLGWPPLGFEVAGGWRHYLDPWGQAALGLNLGYAVQASGDAESPTVHHPRLQLTGRIRGFSETFTGFSLGVYADVGPVFLSGGLAPEDFPALAGESTGLAWSVGVETGPAKLVGMGPYVFGEIAARIGLEVVDLAGVQVRSVTAGLRLGFDWAFVDVDGSPPAAPSD